MRAVELLGALADFRANFTLPLIPFARDLPHLGPLRLLVSVVGR